MSIKILGQDGPGLIRLHIDQQASERDRWKLLVVNDFVQNTALPDSDQFIKDLADNLDFEDGKITLDENGRLMFLVHLADNQTTAQLIARFNKTLPSELATKVIQSHGHKGDIERLILKLIPADSQESPNALLEERALRQEKRALVVDDDSFIRSLFSASLSSQFEIIEVSNGDDAVKAYMEHLPDIVLLDIHMPGITGFDVLEKLLSQDKDAYVTIISADSIQKNVVEAKEKGARGFISKPARKEKLLEYISRCPTIDYRKLVSGATISC